MATMAEIEKKNISARTKRALQERKDAGKLLGRPKVEIPKNFKEMFNKAANGECTHKSVMDTFNIKKATYYKIAKQLGLRTDKKAVGQAGK